MAKYHGKEGVVKVGSSPTLVAEVQSWDISESANQAEGSSKGDSYTTNLDGIHSQSGSIELLYDPEDTNGQEEFKAGQTVDVELYPINTENGAVFFGGKALITEAEVGSPKDDMVSKTVQFVNADGTGITEQTVSGS